ncbi:gas vesicle protein GvpG [Streptomyces sp. NPDC002644]
MGLFTEILLLPFAPVRGTLWIADQVAREAERPARDPRQVQAGLAAFAPCPGRGRDRRGGWTAAWTTCAPSTG